MRWRNYWVYQLIRIYIWASNILPNTWYNFILHKWLCGVKETNNISFKTLRHQTKYIYCFEMFKICSLRRAVDYSYDFWWRTYNLECHKGQICFGILRLFVSVCYMVLPSILRSTCDHDTMREKKRNNKELDIPKTFFKIFCE